MILPGICGVKSFCHSASNLSVGMDENACFAFNGITALKRGQCFFCHEFHELARKIRKIRSIRG